MNRFYSAIAAALVCAMFGAGALAQDRPATSRNADKTKIAPSKGDVQQQQAQPSNETMDANAQRAHSRSNTGSTAPSNAKPQHARVAAGEVRDWRAIDKNHDNLISPEEMEAALKQGGQQSSGTKTKP